MARVQFLKKSDYRASNFFINRLLKVIKRLLIEHLSI